MDLTFSIFISLTSYNQLAYVNNSVDVTLIFHMENIDICTYRNNTSNPKVKTTLRTNPSAYIQIFPLRTHTPKRTRT